MRPHLVTWLLELCAVTVAACLVRAPAYAPRGSSSQLYALVVDATGRMSWISKPVVLHGAHPRSKIVPFLCGQQQQHVSGLTREC
jgi:hypothetical protein